MGRRGYDSLARRLAKRECHGVPPGSVVPHVRRLYEGVVPDTAIPGVVPPANTVVACFTPCGTYLIAFQPIPNEVVAYRFKGVSLSLSSRQHLVPDPGDDPNRVDQPSHDQRAEGGVSLQQGSAHPASSSQSAAQSGVVGRPPADDQATAASQPQPEQQQLAAQQQPPHVPFEAVFEEHWRCCPCPGRQEQISTDFCLVAHGRYLLVATSSPEQQPPPGATGAAELVPLVETTTFHLVDLGNGSLLDSHSLLRDYVELARNQGAHLRGQTLLVLGLASQTLHVIRLLPSGRFMYLHAVGQYCRDDDGWVVAQQEEREQRFRQHHRWRGPGRRARASPASQPALALQRRVDGAGQVGPQQHGPQPGAAGAATQEAEGWRSEEEGSGDDEDHPMDVDRNHAAASVESSPIISGLKQCLLACLFRDAQQQATEAGAAVAGVPGVFPPSSSSGGLPGRPPAGLLRRAAASTGDLPSVAGALNGTARPLGGSGSNLAALPHRHHPEAGDGGAVQPHWRRPLDRFYYYFEAHLELLMWKAQLLDEQRLLIHWCPPEMLAGPHRHQQHGHAPSTAAGGQQGSYLMLFSLATATVEQLFVAHSRELAAWYLENPGAFHGGDCACGCATDWERWVPVPGASRAERDQQLRDPGLATKLRHRLADELPASSQLRQATPYLDPDLYCFDERAIGGAVRPHHMPHRSIKFMCRCQPERLRFRLDTEHLQPVAHTQQAGGRRGDGGSGRAHVVYLFHPIQPFLLTVMQDIETAVAERLTFFTRL